MKCLQSNSRQHPVVLNLIFQRRQLLCDGLAFLGLFTILLGRDSLVHIIDSTSLAVRCVSTSSCFARKDDFSITCRVAVLQRESYHDYGPSVASGIVRERVLVRRVRRGCI
jgi:hypothetical protein